MARSPQPTVLQGFTLIELSIVLVIIGLIVGAIMVGRDLINAAAIRAQVTQIEKYNSAVHSFQLKYNALPGDMGDPPASQFGFAARSLFSPGDGDGNGIIEGILNPSDGVNSGFYELNGETELFWADLSTAHLVDGSFTNANNGSDLGGYNTTAAIGKFFPVAKIGQGNFIYVWSNKGLNYFGLSAVILLTPRDTGSNPGLSVIQAYNIDQKIDDGLPQTGTVTAQYLNSSDVINNFVWAYGILFTMGTPDMSATTGNAATCYDNGGIAGTQHYSTAQNSGTGINCALSFRFQ